MKSVLIDCETTGVDPQKHALIQLAGKIVIDGEEKETFDFKIKPVKGVHFLDEEALKVNRITREMLETYPDSQEQLFAFQGMLSRRIDKYDKKDKAHFIGWNADFDAAFVRKWFELHEDEYFGSWFYYPILDVCKIAGFFLREIRHQFPSFKLITVAQHLGLDFNPDEAHDAAFDIDLTEKIMAMCLDQSIPLQSRYREIAKAKETTRSHW